MHAFIALENAPATAQDVPRASPEKSWLRSFRTRLMVTDVVIVLASVAAALLLRVAGGAPVSSTVFPTYAPVLLPSAAVVVWIWMLAAHRTRDVRVLGSGAAEYRRVLNASVLSFGFLAIAALALGIEGSREYFLVAFPIGTVLLIIGRWNFRQWLSGQRRFGHYLSRALVIGGRADVEYVLQQIAKVGTCYHVVGVVLDRESSRVVMLDGEELPTVVGMHEAAASARAVSADVVIVAGQPTNERDFIRDLAWDLEGTATELILAARLTNVAGPRIHFRPVDGLPLMHVELPQYDGARHVLKRVFDVTVASIALLAVSPLLLVLAALIKLDSPGGAIFRQQRVGRDGRTFTFYKMRTMVAGADSNLSVLAAANDGNGVLFKLRNDPRVTGIGRVLRRYSLDELPQLWNVVLGDMSLVGPRPPLPAEVARYAGHARRRLYIKPGLTGMWQINGRSNLSWEDSIRLDLYYVENWSLAGDLLIMWRTFRVLVRPDGSY